MATKDSLKDLVQERIGKSLFIVVSNREPYMHVSKNGKIAWVRPASGMATGLEPVLRATSGLWVAHGAGEADREVVDKQDKIRVPPDDPQFVLKRVWLSKEEEERYYHGFANRTMWPLCHVVYVRPTFDKGDWDVYRSVNEAFARAVLEEVGDKPAFVWVQDFHLALVPKLLKDARPDLLLAQFWHVPWPTPEIFRLCPWRQEILWGLLANDLLGFHIRFHCDNFLAAVEQELEVRVDRERSSVFSSGHETRVRPYPISVDFQRIGKLAESRKSRKRMSELRKELGLGAGALALGVDRFDYTKGIPERIQAVERLLDKYPEHRGRFTLLQTGPVSRLQVREYQDFNDRVDALTDQVNARYATNGWKPIVLIRRHMDETEMAALYRMADLCIASSLHDGMNLVAKEFPAARTDGDGVLVLSRFTGASRELDHAVLINPYDIEEFADALRGAVEMPQEERRQRMSRMRSLIEEQNVYNWAEQFVSELTRIA